MLVELWSSLHSRWSHSFIQYLLKISMFRYFLGTKYTWGKRHVRFLLRYRETDHEHRNQQWQVLHRFKAGWYNRECLGSGKATHNLTFKLGYNYQEGVEDGESRRKSILAEGMAKTKTLRQERACLACRRMVPDEQNVWYRLRQESDTGKPGQEFPIEKAAGRFSTRRDMKQCGFCKNHLARLAWLVRAWCW